MPSGSARHSRPTQRGRSRRRVLESHPAFPYSFGRSRRFATGPVPGPVPHASEWPMLEVRDVVKTYDGRAVVNHVSFEVAPGEIFALLGPNGAGKTTLIRMITDILRPDAGAVMLDGEPMGSRRARVSYLPEERGLYRRSRVVDVLVYYGELKGMTAAEARTDALALLKRV